MDSANSDCVGVLLPLPPAAAEVEAEAEAVEAVERWSGWRVCIGECGTAALRCRVDGCARDGTDVPTVDAKNASGDAPALSGELLCTYPL